MNPDASFACASCEGLAAAPVIHVGLPFCCAGCAAGGPCVCSYDDIASDPDGTALEEDLERVAGPAAGARAPGRRW